LTRDTQIWKWNEVRQKYELRQKYRGKNGAKIVRQNLAPKIGAMTK
jgi:hypothetical protein